MGMILRIASSRIVGQGDIVGRSGYFSLNLSANSVMRGRLDARRTLKSLVADLRFTNRCLSENTPNRILPHNPWNIHARFLHKAGRIYNTYARELYFFHEGTIDLRRRIYRCNAKDL